SALSGLLSNTVADYHALTRGAAAEALIKAAPVLCVYADEQAYQKDSFVWALRQRHGVRWHVLSGAELHETEPALAKGYQYAAAFDECGYTLNPQRLAKLLFDEFIHHGGVYRRAEVNN